ncbi:MAG: FAD-dependent oxidoreductase [Caldilineaceae bacterium]|nr:FAD-dependent oxidoreductase [Caldilineaceae bacterium]
MQAEVVICGAGIAGVATAYYLGVRHNLWNVALVDPAPPLSQTNSKVRRELSRLVAAAGDDGVHRP